MNSLNLNLYKMHKWRINVHGLIKIWIYLKIRPDSLKPQTFKSMWGGGFVMKRPLPPLSWKLDDGNSTFSSRGRAVMVGWRMKVRMPWGGRLGQESRFKSQTLQMLQSWGTLLLHSFIPSFLQYFWTFSFVPEIVGSVRDKGKICFHGA